MDLVLAQEELLQGVHCDVWIDKNRNPFINNSFFSSKSDCVPLGTAI